MATISKEYFLSKVNKTSSCWLWIGSINSARGYGIYGRGKQRMYAHRLSYKLFVGPIPNRMLNTLEKTTINIPLVLPTVNIYPIDLA